MSTGFRRRAPPTSVTVLSATLLLSAIALLHPIGAKAALIDNGDGTVSDTLNPTLIWSKEAFYDAWQDAKAHREEGN